MKLFWLCRAMIDAKIGALIVIERDIGLRTFIESGVALDAVVSRDLLCSIFERGGALHDGAVIIQGDRVAAAACFLPLTTNPGDAAAHGHAASRGHRRHGRKRRSGDGGF